MAQKKSCPSKIMPFRRSHFNLWTTNKIKIQKHFSQTLINFPDRTNPRPQKKNHYLDQSIGKWRSGSDRATQSGGNECKTPFYYTWMHNLSNYNLSNTLWAIYILPNNRKGKTSNIIKIRKENPKLQNWNTVQEVRHEFHTVKELLHTT